MQRMDAQSQEASLQLVYVPCLFGVGLFQVQRRNACVLVCKSPLITSCRSNDGRCVRLHSCEAHQDGLQWFDQTSAKCEQTPLVKLQPQVWHEMNSIQKQADIDAHMLHVALSCACHLINTGHTGNSLQGQ